MRTKEEIKNQIERLNLLKTKLPEINGFGENNHEKIDCQIDVIEQELDGDDIYNKVAEDGLDSQTESDMFSAYEWLFNDGDELVDDADLT